MVKVILFLLQIAIQQAASADSLKISDDVTISYRSFGNGDPIIILNGGPGRKSDHFSVLAKEMSELGFNAVIFDQRGTGLSSLRKIDESTITLDAMVEDLEHLRKHLKFRKFFLMGHSFGGIYAMEYANRYPDRLKGIILSASPGLDLDWLKFFMANAYSRIDDKARLEHQRLTVLFKNCASDESVKIRQIVPLLPAYVYDRSLVATIEPALLDPGPNYCLVNSLVWKDLQKKRFDLNGKFQNFKQPVLIISGRQDLYGEGIPLALNAAFPNSTLAFIEKCSHYPWLDQPTKFFKILESFVKRTGSLP